MMNRWDIDNAVARYRNEPNLLALALTVRNLRDWADNNSDGWVYWPKPARAAKQAFIHLDNLDRRRGTLTDDITDAELKRALTPIKAFLTREGVSHHEIIVTDVQASIF